MAALAVAVLLTMLCQLPLYSCGFYQFPFSHPVYAVGWASLHVKDWSSRKGQSTTSNKQLFLLHAPSESSGKPWKAHCFHHSCCPQFCLSPCSAARPAAIPHLNPVSSHSTSKSYFISHQLCPKLPQDPFLPRSLTSHLPGLGQMEKGHPFPPPTSTPLYIDWLLWREERDKHIFYLPEPS